MPRSAAIVPRLPIPPTKVETAMAPMPSNPPEIVPILVMPPALPLPKALTWVTAMPAFAAARIVPLLTMPPVKAASRLTKMPEFAEIVPPLLLVMPPANAVTAETRMPTLLLAPTPPRRC